MPGYSATFVATSLRLAREARPSHSYLKPAPPHAACSFVTYERPAPPRAAAVVVPRLVMIVLSALRSLRGC